MAIPTSMVTIFSSSKGNLGTGTTKAEGDTDGDVDVDGVDVNNWKNEFGERDPATIEVTGAGFADPFDPGNNQSMVLHNPNGSSQMSVTWTNEFMDDPNSFRNGTIEYDVWMESPDEEAFWTFLSMRHRAWRRESKMGSVARQPTQTVWNTFRMQNVGEPPDPIQILEQASDPGHRITLGSEGTYSDDNSAPDAGAFGPDQSFHIRYEIDENGYSFGDLPTYRLFINDIQIEWMALVTPDAAEPPWVLQPGPALAPGINILSFFTDASAFWCESESRYRECLHRQSCCY